MTVSCAKCGTQLTYDFTDPANIGQPCPTCGATERSLEVSAENHLRAIEKLKIRQYEQGSTDWSKEVVSGEEVFHETGEIRSVQRIVDKSNRHQAGSYSERIVRTDSGEIVREVSERFVDHQGRGSAKRKVPTFPDEWI